MHKESVCSSGGSTYFGKNLMMWGTQVLRIPELFYD